MRAIHSLALAVVTFSMVFAAGCATTANYEARVHSWEGKDVKVLLANWGQPDDSEKLSNGNKMLVYARLKHYPVAYNGTKPEDVATATSPRKPASEIYVKCATYFEVSPVNLIIATQFRGDECKWKD
jgi:hypothetical protein